MCFWKESKEDHHGFLFQSLIVPGLQKITLLTLVSILTPSTFGVAIPIIANPFYRKPQPTIKLVFFKFLLQNKD